MTTGKIVKNIKNILATLLLGTWVPLALAQTPMLPATPRNSSTFNPPSAVQSEAVNAAAQVKRLEFEQMLSQRFVVQGNEVYDKKTDLTWQRCNYGQTWDDAAQWCRGVTKRLTVSQALAEVEKNHSGWRLPDVGEIMSLLEVACANTKTGDNPVPVFLEVLPNTYYLSSSIREEQSTVNVGQCFGSTANNYGVGKGYVSVARLVRSGRLSK